MRREDYERLIDSEVWAFIRRTDDWFPPESIGLPIERQREIYNAMCRALHAGRPSNVARPRRCPRLSMIRRRPCS
jgi:acetyl esterase